MLREKGRPITCFACHEAGSTPLGHNLISQAEEYCTFRLRRPFGPDVGRSAVRLLRQPTSLRSGPGTAGHPHWNRLNRVVLICQYGVYANATWQERQKSDILGSFLALFCVNPARSWTLMLRRQANAVSRLRSRPQRHFCNVDIVWLVDQIGYGFRDSVG